MKEKERKGKEKKYEVKNRRKDENKEREGKKKVQRFCRLTERINTKEGQQQNKKEN